MTMVPGTSRELLPFPVADVTFSDVHVDGCASRQRRSQRRQAAAEQGWALHILHALNWAYGQGSGQHSRLSASQSLSLQQFSDLVREAGPPPMTTAAVFSKLSGSAPGYGNEPVSSAAFGDGPISLPTPGVKCKGVDMPEGEPRALWTG